MTGPDAEDDAAAFEAFREQARRQVPPVVYLPVSGVEDRTHEVELRPTKDGRVALLAYTALDRLAACCGPHQPWLLYPTDRLPELEQSQPYDVIYLDLSLPEELRRQDPAATDGAAEQPEVDGG